MRLVFISLYEAYPPISGAAYVTYSCARLTPGSVQLVQFADRDAVEQVEKLTVVSVAQQTTSRLKKLASMPRAIMRIRHEILKVRPDYVVLEGASWAFYLLILVLVLRKSFPEMRVVYHAHNVEYNLRRDRENRFLAALTRYAEGGVVATCDKCFAVSEEDCEHFALLYGIKPDLLPNGIDCRTERPSVTQVDEARKRYGLTDESILFIGLYAYPPNTEAVRFLIEGVMPELHRRRPNLRLVVTGGGPLTGPPWLINTGILSRRDLDAVLRGCRAGVAPIFKGSGTRLKILEYMSAGLPVVSTKKGAEGLNLEDETHILYAETSSEFQNALLRVLDDQTLSQNLSIRAMRLVRAKFDWIPLLRRFATQLENE